eukprot:scaffold11661_cov22-Tisochrysis_lutea.AAC.2
MSSAKMPCNAVQAKAAQECQPVDALLLVGPQLDCDGHGQLVVLRLLVVEELQAKEKGQHSSVNRQMSRNSSKLVSCRGA